MSENVSPTEALRKLREGNERFASDTRSIAPLLSQVERQAHAQGQSPIAIILTCSDSRVPAEMIFDRGIGDLFVIRVAGNVVAPSLVGSVEFAATAFGTRLIVAMGHTGCGAVRATLDVLRGKAEVPTENIRDIVERIQPSTRSVMDAGTNLDDAVLLGHAIRANVRASADHLRHGSKLLEEMVGSGRIVVVGAEYNLSTGKVDFFDVPPNFDER